MKDLLVRLWEVVAGAIDAIVAGIGATEPTPVPVRVRNSRTSRR